MVEEIGSGVNQGVDVELPRTTAVFGEKVRWNLDDPDVMMANVSENHGTVEENGGEEALRGGEEIGMDGPSVGQGGAGGLWEKLSTSHRWLW